MNLKNYNILKIILWFAINTVHANQNVMVHGGQEFQINTNATSEQIRPYPITLNNGNFVVVWQSKPDSSDINIHAQLFDQSANKIGNEFVVNSNTAGEQKVPCAAVLVDGNFVVVWSSDGQDGDSWGVYAQMFNESGAKIGNEFKVNTYTSGVQDHPWIATLENGNFVVAWHSYGQDGSGGGIYAQIFNSSGTKMGSEFQVNSNIATNQVYPKIMALENDKFVIAWYSSHTGNDSDVFFQIFNFPASKIGSEIQANTYTTNAQNSVSIASLANDKFIISWDSLEQDGSDTGIYAQIFDSNGNKIGNEFRANANTIDSQEYSSIVSIRNSNFVIVWRSDNQDGSASGVFGQIFDSSGAKISDEFQANMYTTSHQHYQGIAALKNGNFLIVWHSLAQDGDDYGIFGRIFTPNTIPEIGKVTKTGTKNNILAFNSTDFSNVFSDTDNNMHKISILSLPSYGDLKLLDFGAVTENQEILTNNIKKLVFEPDSDWTGSTQFGWKAFDGLDYSDSNIISIEITEPTSNSVADDSVNGSSCGVGCIVGNISVGSGFITLVFVVYKFIKHSPRCLGRPEKIIKGTLGNQVLDAELYQT